MGIVNWSVTPGAYPEWVKDTVKADYGLDLSTMKKVQVGLADDGVTPVYVWRCDGGWESIDGSWQKVV